MTPPVVLLNVSAIPVAVVRRHVKPFELSRAVPECCGLAWKAVRAQDVKAGRNVAIYWDGSIRLEAGVELQGPFAEEGAQRSPAYVHCGAPYDGRPCLPIPDTMSFPRQVRSC